MALQVQSSKSAFTALTQGFLVRKTTSHAGNKDVWDRARDENHIARFMLQNTDPQTLGIQDAKGEINTILAALTVLRSRAELSVN